MSGDWRQQLQAAEQAYAEMLPELDAEYLKQFSADPKALSGENVAEQQRQRLKGPLSGLTKKAFEPPEFSISETFAAEAVQLIRLLHDEENELMEVVDGALEFRDQLIEAQANQDAGVDLVDTRASITSISTKAGYSQLRCAHIDVSGAAAHKNMAVREWKSSLSARYTKLQKVLIRLLKIVDYLESSSSNDRPMPFSEYVSKVKCRWERHQEMQRKLDVLNASGSPSVCSSYVADVHEGNLQVIQEVFGFLASPASQNHALMLYSRPLTVLDVMIPLRLCATSATMYGSLAALYLCDCQLTDDHVSKLSTVLPELRNLQVVAFRDNNVTCLGAVELGQVLKRCKDLRKLWLDGNQIRARGAEGLHLHSNLHGTAIEQISLSRNPVGDSGLYFMLRALLNPLRKAYYTMQVPAGVHKSMGYRRKSESTLTTTTSLPHISAIGRRVRQVFVRLIAVHCFLMLKSRGRNTPVLLLEDMQLTARGVGMISHVLQENNSITALYLSKNSIRDEGAISLAAALPHAINLQTLDIACNAIGERGIEVLMRTADKSQSLQSFELSGNEVSGTGLNWITSMGRSFYMDEIVLQGRQFKSRKPALPPRELPLMASTAHHQPHSPYDGSPTRSHGTLSRDNYDLL